MLFVNVCFFNSVIMSDIHVKHVKVPKLEVNVC